MTRARYRRCAEGTSSRERRRHGEQRYDQARASWRSTRRASSRPGALDEGWHASTSLHRHTRGAACRVGQRRRRADRGGALQRRRFESAQDLRRCRSTQVSDRHRRVDEGQKATFGGRAFRSEFAGRYHTVRNAPITVQNVVSRRRDRSRHPSPAEAAWTATDDRRPAALNVLKAPIAISSSRRANPRRPDRARDRGAAPAATGHLALGSAASSARRGRDRSSRQQFAESSRRGARGRSIAVASSVHAPPGGPSCGDAEENEKECIAVLSHETTVRSSRSPTSDDLPLDVEVQALRGVSLEIGGASRRVEALGPGKST